MFFYILPKIDRVRKIQVQYIPESNLPGKERFEIYGKQKVVIESNRPLLRRKGIKSTRRPTCLFKILKSTEF